MTANDSTPDDVRIDRRKILLGIGALGALGTRGVAARGPKGGGPGNGNPGQGGPGGPGSDNPGQGGPGGPCFKNFECDGLSVKFEVVESGTGCSFEEETDTGLVEITDWESTDGEACEPVSVTWEADGYVATSVMAFGGNDCDTVENPDGSYSADRENGGLVNNGGQTAAISNLQFCLEETPETLPECPLYGTSRSDPTAIFSIQYDPGTDEVTEAEVGDIPDESNNSNYPNGVAFDDTNDVWYFTEQGGLLKTMNEDGSLGIETYEVITDGSSIAGAAFYDGGYYFTPQGGDTLQRAELDGNSVTVTEVCDLPLGNLTFGDIAIDRDADPAIVYFSVNGAFFQVTLDTCASTIIVESDDRTSFAVLSQIAFAEETLWAHNAGTGEWRTVDLDDGSLSDVIDTTREYTDLARCGFYELDESA